MRAVMVIKNGRDETRPAETFVADFKRVTGTEIEIVDPETIPGETFSRAYDVTLYPTLMVLANDGAVQASWRGLSEFPLFDELSGYMRA